MTRPAWLEAWPIAHPHAHRCWTVRSEANWGLLDPETGVVSPVDPTTDRQLPGLAEAMKSGRLIGYRAQRRAIVRSGRDYVKIVRPSRVDQVVETHQLVAGARIPVMVPKVIGSDGDGRIQLQTLPGLSLHQLIRSQQKERLSLPVEQIADALLHLHLIGSTDRGPSGDPSHTWPTLVGRAEPAAVEELRAVADQLPPVPVGTPALVHGDLHDKNIIVGRGAIGLIDLD